MSSTAHSGESPAHPAEADELGFEAGEDGLNDRLTGLRNWRFLTARLAEETARSLETNSPLGLLFMEVDSFSALNEHYKPDQGDKALRHVAEVLRGELGEEICLARYAGDEFVALLPGTAPDEALRRAEKLVVSLGRRPVHLVGAHGDVRVTMSVGVAACPRDSRDPAGLLNCAERACLVAKARGRNQAVAYQAEFAASRDRAALLGRLPTPRLVGRKGLAGELFDLLLGAPPEPMPVVLLQGPAGVGKTRLLQELVGRLDPVLVTLLQAEGRPPGPSQPFGLVVEALARLVRLRPETGQRMMAALQKASALADEQVVTVARLLPDLAPPRTGEGPHVPRVPDILPEAFTRMILSLTEETATLAEDKRVFVVFDEFQWADPGTLATLTHLCEKGGRVSILLAMRAEPLEQAIDPETGAREAALRDFLSRMMRAGRLRSVPLLPLTRAQVAEMVAAVAPGLEEEGDLLDLLWQRSQGLPRTVEENLRFLAATEYIRPDPEGEGLYLDLDDPPPEDPAELLSRHLDRLEEKNEDLPRILCRASALGRRFSFESLAEIEDRDPGYLRDILETARREALLLRRLDGGQEYWEFYSESEHELFYQRMDEEERRAAHAAVAQSMAVLTDSLLAEHAYQRSRGGDLVGAERFMAMIQGRYEHFWAPSPVIPVGSLADLTRLEAPPLTEEQLQQGLEVARLFKVGVATTRMYRPEHENVKNNYRAFYQHLKGILHKIPSLDFSEADGALLINGSVAANQSRAPEMANILSDLGVRSLSFKQGLTVDEVMAFMRLMLLRKEEVADRGGLGKLLKEAGIVHIVPNEKIFVRVSEKDILFRKKGSDKTVLLKDMDAVRQMLDLPDPDLEVDAEIAEIMQTREAPVSAPDNPEMRLLEKLGEKLAGAGQDGEGEDLEGELERLQNDIKAWYQEVNKYLDLTMLEAVSGEWTVLCRDLESGSRIKMAAASKAFLDRGAEAIDPLVSFVALTDDTRARKIAIS
ncbi:MAG TPA: diguanylate cyclase, partial [Candidatus Nitrosotenuis sp.]|nr:diguanylate cyclase [Candidatus Nitrosotenuis sp.]